MLEVKSKHAGNKKGPVGPFSRSEVRMVIALYARSDYSS